MFNKNNLKNRTLLLSSIANVALKFLGLAMNFVVFLLITNYFSEEEVGQFNFLTYLLMLLGLFCLFGTQNSIFQITGKFESFGEMHKVKSTYYRILKLNAIIYLGTLSIGFSVLYTFKDYMISEFDLILLSLIFSILFTFNTINIQFIRALNQIIFSEFLRSVARYGFLLILVFFGAFDWLNLPLVYLFILSIVLLSIISSIFVFKLLVKIPRTDSEAPKTKEIAKISYPMMISGFTLLLIGSMDVFILKFYYDFETIAFYGIAVKLALLQAVVLEAINTIVAPMFAKMFFANQSQDLKQLINKALLLIVAASTPLLLLLFLFPKTLLSFFGENYTVAATALVILGVGQAFNMLCGSVSTFLNMIGKQLVVRNILFLVFIVNITLNFLFIPRFGMVGAACSSAFSIILWNAISVVYVYNKYKIVMLFPLNLIYKNKNNTRSL